MDPNELEELSNERLEHLRATLQDLGEQEGWHIIQTDLAAQHQALTHRLMMSADHDDILRTQGALRLLNTLVEGRRLEEGGDWPLRHNMIGALTEEEGRRLDIREKEEAF